MNYMKQVAEMLGVSMNEEFEVLDKYYDGRVEIFKCKITECGMYVGNEEDWIYNHEMLAKILAGDNSIEIKKPPFVPRVFDTYWTITNKTFHVKRETWDDHAIDYARMKCGMVFRTKNEAIDARPRIYEELTGKKWSDRP